MNDIDDLLQSAGGVPVPVDFQEAIDEIQADLTPVADEVTTGLTPLDDLFSAEADEAFAKAEAQMRGQVATGRIPAVRHLEITSMVSHNRRIYLALSDGRLIASVQARTIDKWEEVDYNA